MGYVFMDMNMMHSAEKTFTLNTILFQANANAWDSLAEFYERKGDRGRATHCYRELLRLKPDDANAKAKLAALK